MSVRSLRYNTATQHFTKSALASTDRDALAFLEAAQIYNTNQQRAIVNLVRSLKRVGLWTKMKAIYPFIGGTASSHKWNLKDPRDSDAAFRLTFTGGWTHSSTGALPNATNTYAETYLTPSTSLSLNDTHLSFYSRTSSTGTYADMGSAGVTLNNDGYLQLLLRWSDNIFYTQLNDVDFSDATVTNSQGYFIGSRRASNDAENYKNGTTVKTKTGSSTQLTNKKIFIGARNLTTGISNYSNRECAFATIGDGLTDTDATNLYNIVDLYQKRLGRAV